MTEQNLFTKSMTFEISINKRNIVLFDSVILFKFKGKIVEGKYK